MSYELAIDEYMKFTRSTVAYQPSSEGDYLTAGLASSVGKLYGSMAEYHKGNVSVTGYDNKARDDMGDIFWFMVRLCDYYGWKPSEVLEDNMNKLTRRKLTR